MRDAAGITDPGDILVDAARELIDDGTYGFWSVAGAVPAAFGPPERAWASRLTASRQINAGGLRGRTLRAVASGMRMNTERVRLVMFATVLSVALASCGWAVTGQPQSVSNTGALLTGDVHSTTSGPTKYWYEYGPTVAYGSFTARRTLDVRDPATAYPVTEIVGQLPAGTLHHVRLCALAATGKGTCGADQRFTTLGARDSVTGTGTVFSIPQLGYTIGGSFDASADPDRSDPVGKASTAPGVFYFRLPDSGPVSCLRVDGNRATIGFVSDPARFGIPPEYLPVFVVAYVEDNGPLGDRFGLATFPSPVPCPAATAADFSDFQLGDQQIPPVVTVGDFVVRDAIAR